MVVPLVNAGSHSWLGLIAASLIWSTSGSPARAFDNWTVGLNGYQPRKEDAVYYKTHAQPEPGEVRDTGSGSWLVETDLNTGLGEPRLVRLSNGRSIARANDALQAVHGRILQLERARRRELDQKDDPAVTPSSPTVSYFSPTTLSYVVRGEQLTGGTMRLPIVRGTTLDIKRGTVSTIMACRNRRPFFTLGSLLSVCDRPRLGMFRALWLEQARKLQATAQQQGKVWNEDCRALTSTFIDIQDEELGHDFGFVFSLYLTPAGLAVHQQFTIFGRDNGCVLDPQSPFFPTVIPWRKIAPLMNPGPLRDELLALQ
jgi:hypothetical protein